MQRLGVRFYFGAGINVEAYRKVLDEDVLGNWNLSHMHNSLCADVSCGVAHVQTKPTHRLRSYTELAAQVPAGHDLYDIETARQALFKMADDYRSWLQLARLKDEAEETVISVGFSEWHRDANGVVEFRNAA